MNKQKNNSRTLTCLLLTASMQWLIAANAVASTARTIIVSGLGGSAEYDDQFVEFSNAIADHARALADEESDVILLQGKNATKQAILDAISQLQSLDIDDSARVFLVGHGSFDGSDYKYNVPGPDLTGNELIEAVNQLPASQQLLILATSASGAVLEPLQAAHRVVITATKNGRERNAVKFTEYMVAGLADPSADLDKDEIISAQELFQFAERAVAKHYETEKLLASEHARLNGEAAAKFELSRYGSLLANQSEISDDLLTQRQEISTRITVLRNRKSDLTEDEYFDQLQGLMLELAEVQRAIDEPVQNTEPTGTTEQTPEQESGQHNTEQSSGINLDDDVGSESTTDEAAPGVD